MVELYYMVEILLPKDILLINTPHKNKSCGWPLAGSEKRFGSHNSLLAMASLFSHNELVNERK
jgi:hypothetical protein